jgi:hypothetical protein
MESARFRLARSAHRRLLCGRVMASGFRRIAILSGTAALIFFCSCDKHSVGEFPEVQKEHVDLAQEAEAAPEGKAAPVPLTTPTPAEFFPENTPH